MVIEEEETGRRGSMVREGERGEAKIGSEKAIGEEREEDNDADRSIVGVEGETSGRTVDMERRGKLRGEISARTGEGREKTEGLAGDECIDVGRRARISAAARTSVLLYK